MENEKDRFIEIVKEKLTNYTLPVDDDFWEKIADRLNPAPRKNIQPWWLTAIAVAASILLLLLFYPVDKKTSHQETANQLSGQAIIKDVPEKEIAQSVLPQNIEQKKVFTKSQPLKPLVENNLATEVIPEKETAEENSTAVPAAKKEEEQKVIKNHPVSPDFNFGEEEQAPVIKHKKHRSLRFSFGSGANLLAENTTNPTQSPMKSPGVYSNLGASSYFRAAALNVAESRTKEILSYQDYSDITYHLPLSFGVTVKKELNRTFAIESGIVYTFLSTSFYRENFPKANADLQLHYLGIPLNLHTRLFGDRLSQWEVYLATGGMVEKGIFSHFVQKTYYDNIGNAMETIVSNEKINGLQWAVNISPGVDYRLYKNYSIYLEPKVSYYFDNNQPISARTNHPLAVGINAGIRYTWK